jgi:hypothetical protein
MSFFKWVNILISSKVETRLKIVKHCLNAVRLFRKGEKSPEGEQYYKFLTSKNKQLIGFAHDISYIMANNKDKSNLNVLWNHKFSIPTLVYHIEGSPFLLLANANLDYNNSKLLEIADNKEIATEEQWKEILGIIG